MTVEELRAKFNNEFGLAQWPITYEVDHETYANVIHHMLVNYLVKIRYADNIFGVSLMVGINNGILFKGVELILVKK